MIQLNPAQYAALNKMNLSWAFRYRSVSPGETVLFCDLIDQVTRAVVLSAEGYTEELALSAAIELAEGRVASAGDEEAERAALLEERDSLKQQLAEQRAGAQT